MLRTLRRALLISVLLTATASAASPQILPWGIDRIDADLSSTQAGNGQGSVSGVRVYVVDSGIEQRHPDLNVVQHVSLQGSQKACQPHGTWIAGVIGARDNNVDIVGSAPGVGLVGVKVNGCAGFAMSKVIEGIDWVTANAVKPAVANLSIHYPPNQALDDAISRSVASGVTWVIAAGNDTGSACDWSPNRLGTVNGVITVAGITEQNEEWGLSNFGPCVDIWAPATNILTTTLHSGTVTQTGTSFAAPHVAGTAALYLSQNPNASPADVEAALKAAATFPGSLSKDGRPVQLVNAAAF